MSGRNILALILTIVSIALLIPGLYLPILSIDIGAKLPIVGELNLHSSIQSIIQTIETLFSNNNAIVGFLILLFSVIVPIAKAILIITSIFLKDLKRRTSIQKVLSIIGKWSMADVFVVGLFIAFLSTSSDDNIHASIHSGFYFFLAYCITSIIAFQVFDPNATKR